MGGFGKGWKHWASSVVKGDLGGAVKGFVQGSTLGMVKTVGDNVKPSAQQAREELHENAKDALKRRKALFGTSGGVLGEEVDKVSSSHRGQLFGN